MHLLLLLLLCIEPCCCCAYTLQMRAQHGIDCLTLEYGVCIGFPAVLICGLPHCFYRPLCWQAHLALQVRLQHGKHVCVSTL